MRANNNNIFLAIVTTNWARNRKSAWFIIVLAKSLEKKMLLPAFLMNTFNFQFLIFVPCAKKLLLCVLLFGWCVCGRKLWACCCYSIDFPWNEINNKKNYIKNKSFFLFSIERRRKTSACFFFLKCVYTISIKTR